MRREGDYFSDQWRTCIIELTQRGKAVAVVLSLREFARLRGDGVSFGDAYQRFLANHVLADVGIDDSVFAAVRNREVGRNVAL